jgi:hypothetical protein
VEGLQAVARRVPEEDQVGDVALVGQAAGGAADRDAVRVQPRRQRVERRRVRHLPAEEGEPFACLLAGDDQALAPVVHAEGAHRPRAVHPLHAEQPGRVGVPVVEPRGADADVAESRQPHGTLPRTHPE